MDAHALTDAAQGGGAAESAAAASPTYLEKLLAAGLLIDTGVQGLYGRSAVFEGIADGLNAAITRTCSRECPRGRGGCRRDSRCCRAAAG